MNSNSINLEHTTAQQTIAAIDLGSNSFHLIVARTNNDRLEVIDKLKETVRLGAGLDNDGIISEKAIARAVACLERFGQRLRNIPSENIRVVGTNAMRRAHNRDVLQKQGEKALGHRVDVISGREEARLIYAGVSNLSSTSKQKQLVVDIGGGSTELIIGQDSHPLLLESLFMGCVSFTERYFPNGKLSAKRMDNAILAARRELEVIQKEYIQTGWQKAIGSSGTLLAIHSVLNKLWPDQGGISPAALDKFIKQLVACQHIDEIKFCDLPAERTAVLPGGLAIARGVIGAMKLESMGVSDGALREGLLFDLIDRIRQRDIRDTTVTDMMQRFALDKAQAARISQMALQLFDSVAKTWELDSEKDQKLLRWATQLHEIGRFVAHSGYHKHGGYIAQHYDMRGFTREDQKTLAQLIRNHRRKFALDSEEYAHSSKLAKLCTLLRLAVVLHRGRSDIDIPIESVNAEENTINISFTNQWLETHPLTQADLDQESHYLDSVNIKLKISSPR